MNKEMSKVSMTFLGKQFFTEDDMNKFIEE